MRQLPPTRAIGTSRHDRRPSGVCLLRPDPFDDVELHSAAECFIAQMRICDLRIRIVRDGHKPNEAEEQRPCCVPIEPVHVTSSPKDRREQEGYQNSGSSVKIAGVTSQVSILAFCQHHRRAFGILRHRSRWRNIGYPIEQQITLCEDLGHHATSLRSSTRQGLGAWIASTLFQTALFTANTGARGRCLDIDYCTISPCSARSRPSRSMSCVTRRPTTFLTTKRMIKLATAS